MAPHMNHVERRASRKAAVQNVAVIDDAKPLARSRARKRIRITLQDHGQDFTWWILEERNDGYSYAVVDCGPFQAWFWTKFFVAKHSVKVGQCPLVTRDEKDATHLKYAITAIEPVVAR